MSLFCLPLLLQFLHPVSYARPASLLFLLLVVQVFIFYRALLSCHLSGWCSGACLCALEGLDVFRGEGRRITCRFTSGILGQAN